MTVIRHYRHIKLPSEVRPIRGVVLSFFAAIGLFVLVFGVGGFYVSGWDSWWPKPLHKVTPLPVAAIDGRILWYPTVAGLAGGVAASNDRTTPTEDDYNEALNLGIRRLRIDELADELDVEVAQADVDSEYVEDKDLTLFLETAGWSTDEYKRLLLRPFVISRETEEAVLAVDKYQTQSKLDLADVQEKLTRGIAFEDVAAQYSQDPSALSKGSLGYVLPEEVDPAFAPAFVLAAGDVTPVIETSTAYWILKVEAIAPEGDRYFLRGIAVQKDSLSDIVDKLMEVASPWIFVR
jgi:hypothetical protein